MFKVGDQVYEKNDMLRKPYTVAVHYPPNTDVLVDGDPAPMRWHRDVIGLKEISTERGLNLRWADEYELLRGP